MAQAFRACFARSTLGLACAVVAVTAWAGHQAAETAGRRLRGDASAIGNRLRHPDKRGNSDIGRLDDGAFRARAAEVARELASDLRDRSLKPREKYDALDGLKQMGVLGAPASEALVAALHDHEDDPSYGVPFFCAVTRAMAAVAPSDPAAIRALADALRRDAKARRHHQRSTCAFEALRAAGPAAGPLAGPLLEDLARTHRPYGPALPRAIDASGAAKTMARTLVARATDEEIGIDERVATLHALGTSYGELTPDDKAAVHATAERLLTHKYVDIRSAAAAVLGRAGPGALGALVSGLEDQRYDVRLAAVRSLARLGPAAAPARGRLIAALDPFLGTGEAAAEALVAIGTPALAEVEAHARSAPRPLRPLVEATVRAIRAGNMAPVREALAKAYTQRPGGGYIDVEVRKAAGDGLAYLPKGFRIKARFSGGPYAPSSAAPPTIEGTLTVDDAPNAFFGALVGRRAGDRVRILLSPETIPDPYSAVQTVGRPPQRLPVATGAVFEVEVERVCEPILATVFRGDGMVGPIRPELYCR